MVTKLAQPDKEEIIIALQKRRVLSPAQVSINASEEMIETFQVLIIEKEDWRQPLIDYLQYNQLSAKN